jgi:4-hydroxybenzoate polyprenyltransferase
MKNQIAIARPHHWVKNFLVLVPLAAAHRWDELDAIMRLGAFFFAFCLVASAIYIYNDWIDVDSDRLNPLKKKRPLASGALSVRVAMIEAVLLLIVGACAAWWCGHYALEMLAGYVAINVAYSHGIKRMPVLDLIVLASYYVIRLVGGGLVADVPISPWLAGFSLFFFLSLGISKRYAELASASAAGRVINSSRGYRSEDLPVLSMMGLGSGMISVLVLSNYINSDQVGRLYERPFLIWGLCPALLYWTGRLWLITCRGELHEDPVVFAIKDRLSYCLAIYCALLIWLATPLPTL